MGADHPSAVGTATAAVPGPAAPAPPTGADVEAVPEPAPTTGVVGLIRRRIRAFPWLRKRNDLLIALGCTVADLASYLSSDHRAGPHMSVVGALLVVFAGGLLILRRRYPLYVLLGVVAAYVAMSMVVSMTVHSISLSLVVALYAVARTGTYPAIAVAGGAMLAGQAVHLVRETESTPWMLPADALAIGVVIMAGVGVGRWRDQVELNRRLLADRAVADERRRIARELHDIVAHHITTMYLMSGGARATLDRDPDTAREALITLESSGRTALREMRQLLGVLRSTDVAEDAPAEPQPGMHEIDRLLAESRAAGLPVEYEELGESRPLPRAIGLTLYRIVQEALTNARKHAGNARAFVRVEYRSDRVAVEICDDGDGRGGGGGRTGMAGGGYGLLGMRERVAVHGGTLETGRRAEGGYRVAALVPLPPVEPGEDWN
ncbi:sensor histidine kinase [Embleya sp. AB8]|uniref:sensor histidine kinase n=1 Tax=Embleya sp. AB8 TaxID=3156304 RepID=UPI003C761BBE